VIDIDNLLNGKHVTIEVPETIEDCKRYYIPPNKKYITCSEFGHMDGMNGSCHWCMEMTPYEWHMCRDEDHLRSLMKKMLKEEAIRFIEDYKRRIVCNKEG
jgi:hypothetical protein